MIKYPYLLTYREFEKLNAKYNILKNANNVYIEPKFDGSNVTCYQSVCLTRNLNPLPQNFVEGLRRALGSSYNTLMNLASKYQVFLELGGYVNSPAGYREVWSREWDYRVFDIFVGRFLEPPRVEKIANKYGLKFVGYEEADTDIFYRLHETLGRYKNYEGFVIKIFFDEPPRLASVKYNMLGIKIKHDTPPPRKTTPTKKHTKSVESVEKGKSELPESEVMGAINKAHLQLGEDIRDRRKAMPLIFKLAREEAEKHGYRPPNPNKLFKLYQQYLRNI